MTVAELMRYAQPYLRNVVILRDPVERYFSAFHYYKNMFGSKEGASAADLDRQVRGDIAAWQSCVKQARALFTAVYKRRMLARGSWAEGQL